MVKWYFSKDRLLNRTPSRTNGVDFPTECRYRREGCRFIMDMGNKLGLRYDTMATGVIYFHRFYMKQSFKTFPRWVTACACLFLAGKVEETPKKCRDIITVAKKMLTDHHFRLFGENPREEVMIYERVLLQTIKFDLQVEHPYSILLKIGKLLKGDKQKVQKLVQMAWTFVNDSLSTSLSLRKRPEILAVAHLNLAGKLANFNLKASTDSPSNKPWWYSFNQECQELVIEEICNEMLELYGAAKKEKPQKKSEKIEPSPNTSSSQSSPSVTNSPPFKKKKLDTKTKEGKSIPSTKSGSKAVAAPPPPPFTAVSVNTNQTVSINATATSAGLQSFENISPVVTSESLPQTTLYNLSSTMSSSNAPSIPSPLVQPTVPYVNPVVPQSAYLASTFSPVTFGIPPPTDAKLPASSSSSKLPAPPNIVPAGFVQTFTNVPQQQSQLQSHTQSLSSFMKTQPPPHILPLPTHNQPPPHIHTQPPPSLIPSNPPPAQVLAPPSLSHMKTQPPLSHIQSQLAQSHIQNQPPPSQVQTEHPLPYFQSQPPQPHIQSQPSTSHLQNQTPRSHIQSQHPPSHMQSMPPQSHMQTQPPPSHIQNYDKSLPDSYQQASSQAYSHCPPLPPHKLFSTMHPQQRTTQPPSMVPRAGMNNVAMPQVSANNNPNWRTSSYNRPPNSRPIGRGGWMR